MEHGTITELLARWAEERPDDLALASLDGAELSHRDLLVAVERGVRVLAAAGVEPGERVALVLPNGLSAAVAFLSVASAATAAPLNPGLTDSELQYYLDDLDARLVLVADDDPTAATAAAAALDIPVLRVASARIGRRDEEWLHLADGDRTAHRGRPARSDDVALVLHTSGTTAKPKIVPLTHANLCASARNVAATLRLDPHDRCLNVMPLFHIHGLVAALLSSMHAGASVICSPGFEAPSFLEWLDRVRPTWYTAVPTMHQAILARAREREPARDHPLRLIRSSSASLAPSVLHDVEETFGVPVIEAYGMTEAAHQMTSNPLPPGERQAGSVGPAAGPEVAIADEDGAFLPQGANGEVVIRGDNVTSGYHGTEDRSSFFGDGWFRTGDLGHLDEAGYLFLSGRKKEIINRGGETIAPRAIDEALLLHPDVSQAVAFAVPDDELGEEVAAAVVPAEGADLSERTLQQFLGERLSWNRMPKRILALDEIPKGPTGKLQRIGLAERLGLTTVRRDAVSDPGSTAASDVVARLLALWREVLKQPDIAADAHFLDAGGDSVTATALALRVEQEFGVEVPLLDFFSAPTVGSQAALIEPLLAASDGG